VKKRVGPAGISGGGAGGQYVRLPARSINGEFFVRTKPACRVLIWNTTAVVYDRRIRLDSTGGAIHQFYRRDLSFENGPDIRAARRGWGFALSLCESFRSLDECHPMMDNPAIARLKQDRLGPFVLFEVCWDPEVHILVNRSAIE